MIEALASLTAITDPVANIAIIGVAVMVLKHHLKLATHEVRILHIERKVFKHD